MGIHAIHPKSNFLHKDLHEQGFFLIVEHLLLGILLLEHVCVGIHGIHGVAGVGSVWEL